MRNTLRAAACFVTGACLAAAPVWAQHDSHTIILPNDIKWADVPSLPAGAKIAVLEGKMNEAGPITARLKFPANYKVPAHFHAGVERVTVLSGTMNFGMGRQAGSEENNARGSGRTAHHAGKMPHFVWTKEEAIARSTSSGRGPSPTSIPPTTPGRSNHSRRFVAKTKRDPSALIRGPGEITMARLRRPDAGSFVPPDEVMFSAAVRAEQARRGSRESYVRQAAAGRFARELSADVIAFIAERDSAFLATASADGQPYVQHRGGPPGFCECSMRALSRLPIMRQQGSTSAYGNLAENERSFCFSWTTPRLGG